MSFAGAILSVDGVLVDSPRERAGSSPAGSPARRTGPAHGTRPGRAAPDGDVDELADAVRVDGAERRPIEDRGERTHATHRAALGRASNATRRMSARSAATRRWRF
jgi:hypothetical protein